MPSASTAWRASANPRLQWPPWTAAYPAFGGQLVEHVQVGAELGGYLDHAVLLGDLPDPAHAAPVADGEAHRAVCEERPAECSERLGMRRSREGIAAVAAAVAVRLREEGAALPRWQLARARRERRG